MFVHDIIKIKYSNEGYLPDYPHHLLSDKEMFHAFMNDGDYSFFHDTYPCPDNSLQKEYNELVNFMKKKINSFDGFTPLPSWIYSYMLGEVIYNHSSVHDRHDLLTAMNMDNLLDEIGVRECTCILELSKQHIRRIPEEENQRPPTMFGEPHVIKYLRILKLSGGA